MIWLMLIILFVVFVYTKVYRAYRYWEDRGVQYVKPVFLIGSIDIFKRKTLTQLAQNIYYSFPEGRYIGIYQFLKPFLIIRDPELIKRITVKEFDSFQDHFTLIPQDVDPLWGNTLFSSTGMSWRERRPILSPAFTGSKMRLMYTLMKECTEELVKYLKAKNAETLELDMKDLFSRFANDVIASTAFGLKCDSLKEKGNAFYLMGKEATTFRAIDFYKLTLYVLSPTLARFLKITVLSKKVREFFISIITETVKLREREEIIRPDLIHLLIEARKGKLKYDDQPEIDTGFSTTQESEIGYSKTFQKVELTSVDMAAQAMNFFLAGFDAISTALCFTCYELAVNSDIQDKLRNEVQETFDKNDGNITYEVLVRMKYMDMVISEALRMWPPAPATDRKANKHVIVKAERQGEPNLLIENDTVLGIPIYALHMDPQFFPDPNKFDPDRFNEENKLKIVPYTYMPFGVGPRNCIGSRFALLEMKLVLFHILKEFQVIPVKKTLVPMKLKKGVFNLFPDSDGFWLGLKRFPSLEV